LQEVQANEKESRYPSRTSPDPHVATHHRPSIIKYYLDNSDNLQCGQERPSCQRCSDVGVTCTGYRNEFDLMHRSEGEKTKLRALRPNINAAGSRISELSLSISPGKRESPTRYSNFMSPSVDQIGERSGRVIAACSPSPQPEPGLSK
jgi:hypothetical protein